jgi:hypothetical protein
MIHAHVVELFLLLRREPVFQTHCEADVQTLDLALEVQHFIELGQRLLLVH